jgi:hypothetical protein
MQEEPLKCWPAHMVKLKYKEKRRLSAPILETYFAYAVETAAELVDDYATWFWC